VCQVFPSRSDVVMVCQIITPLHGALALNDLEFSRFSG